MHDQPISATPATPKEKKFPVMEIFGPTIEGEGKLIGTQTLFIRFGLCDYKCTKCDSMHAVDPKLVKVGAQWCTAKEIAKAIAYWKQFHRCEHIKTITFSGGNPCIHDLTEVVQLLQADGNKILVETQGTKHPDWLRLVDHIVVSPKSPGMGETFEPEVFKEFFQTVCTYRTPLSVKIVVFSAIDLEFAAGVSSLITDWICLEGVIFDLEDNFFLSLGNPYPPVFHIDVGLPLEDGVPHVVQAPLVLGENTSTSDHQNSLIDQKNTLAKTLLVLYNNLSEEIMRDRRLAHAKFLPQLHVLVYGNETGK